jgi:hypothetical protein
MAAGLLVFGAVYLFSFIALGVPVGIINALALRRLYRRWPVEALIDDLTDFFVDLPDPGTIDTITERRRTLILLAVHARNFERWWPRYVHTGDPTVDAVAHDWARRVGQRVRAGTQGLLTGQLNLADLAPMIGGLVADLILHHDFAPTEPVDVTIERVNWLRRTGRALAAASLLALSLTFLLAAALQPGLPDALERAGLSALSQALRLDGSLRGAALSAGVLTLSIFTRLVAPSAYVGYPLPFGRSRQASK